MSSVGSSSSANPFALQASAWDPDDWVRHREIATPERHRISRKAPGQEYSAGVFNRVHEAHTLRTNFSTGGWCSTRIHRVPRNRRLDRGQPPVTCMIFNGGQTGHVDWKRTYTRFTCIARGVRHLECFVDRITGHNLIQKCTNPAEGARDAAGTRLHSYERCDCRCHVAI